MKLNSWKLKTPSQEMPCIYVSVVPVFSSTEESKVEKVTPPYE